MRRATRGLTVIAIVGAFVLLRDSRAEQTDRRLDVLGSLLVTLGLSAVIYGTVSAEQNGWGSATTLAPLLGGLAVLIALGVVLWAITRAIAGPAEPIDPARLVD